MNSVDVGDEVGLFEELFAAIVACERLFPFKRNEKKRLLAKEADKENRGFEPKSDCTELSDLPL